MKQSKSILAIILSVIFAISLLLHSVCVGANEEVTVTIDDTALSFDVEPQIINGRTLVPLRKIFEELGAYVKWDGETQTVSAKRNSKTVTLTIDSADMQIDKGDTDEDGNAVIETVTLDVIDIATSDDPYVRHLDETAHQVHALLSKTDESEVDLVVCTLLGRLCCRSG